MPHMLVITFKGAMRVWSSLWGAAVRAHCPFFGDRGFSADRECAKFNRYPSDSEEPFPTPCLGSMSLVAIASVPCPHAKALVSCQKVAVPRRLPQVLPSRASQHYRRCRRAATATRPRAMLLEHLPALEGKRIVLASASPRRRELLTQMGLKFEVRGRKGAEGGVAMATSALARHPWSCWRPPLRTHTTGLHDNSTLSTPTPGGGEQL